MKRHPLFTALPVASLVLAALLVTPPARADVPGLTMDFEDYQLGELLGQDAWGTGGGWLGAWAIIERTGPDGSTTKCLATTANLANNWPRAHFTVATDRLTRYGWPTTGKYRLSFDVLFTRALPINIYFLGAQRANIFQFAYNSRADRIQTTPGAPLANNVVANPEWHHVEVDMDFATSKLDFFCDGRTITSGNAFNTAAESLTSFGEIILQFAANGADTAGANDGFYLDNLRICRTDVDPSEITVVLFR